MRAKGREEGVVFVLWEEGVIFLFSCCHRRTKIFKKKKHLRKEKRNNKIRTMWQLHSDNRRGE